MAKKVKVTKEEIKELKAAEQIDENSSSDINENKKKYDGFKILSLILNCVLVVAILILVSNYEDKVEKVEKERDSIDTTCAYKTEIGCSLNYSSEISKAKFLDDNIVFVLEGYGNVYYTYDCVQKVTSGEYSYWAYNKDAAISKGYKAGKC